MCRIAVILVVSALSLPSDAFAQVANLTPLQHALVKPLVLEKENKDPPPNAIFFVERGPALHDVPYGLLGGTLTYLLFRKISCLGEETGECDFFKPAAFAIGFPIGFIVGLGVGSAINPP